MPPASTTVVACPPPAAEPPGQPPAAHADPSSGAPQPLVRRISHHTRIVVLTRSKDLDGATLFFTFPGSHPGRSAHSFIARDRVPDFDGDEAAFEVEKVREAGCPWPRWRVVRRVG